MCYYVFICCCIILYSFLCSYNFFMLIDMFLRDRVFCFFFCDIIEKVKSLFGCFWCVYKY